MASLSEIACVHHWLDPNDLSGVGLLHVLVTLISANLAAMLLASHSYQRSLTEPLSSLQWLNSQVNQKSLFMQEPD